MTDLVIVGERSRLRPYFLEDAPALQRVADDELVARWMTRSFPHPYTPADAEAWVAQASTSGRSDFYAIEVEGTLAGGAGVQPLHGEHDGCALFGYWLGRAYWGRGIGTDAARTLARYAFEGRGLRRLEATVFAPNLASMRVLEKSGFRREALLRGGYVERDGTIVDGMLYARLASDPEPSGG